MRHACETPVLLFSASSQAHYQRSLRTESGERAFDNEPRFFPPGDRGKDGQRLDRTPDREHTARVRRVLPVRCTAVRRSEKFCAALSKPIAAWRAQWWARPE